MPRPCSERRIGYRQEADFYKPAGVPMSQLTISVVELDEMEAIRLVDVESLNQTEAAERMGVSQSTVARLLESGRRKMASAVVSGQAFAINPGDAPVEFYGCEDRDGRRRE